MDKLRVIQEAGESINQTVMGALQLPIGSDLTIVYRNLMKPSQVNLLDLALFCESEMIKSNQSGAHLSSCLMGAAMNEAFLAVMCLLFEQQVRGTRKFHHSTKKLKNFVYCDVVATWSLEQFICVAEECDWISPNIVDKNFITALADSFRELAPVTHPELSEEDVEKRAQSFFAAPGPSMLRTTQMLRNSIHAGKWMRQPGTFDAKVFEVWCRFATVLCGEIRLCLMHHVMAHLANVASAEFSKMQEMLTKLPPEAIPFIELQMREKLNCPTFEIKDLSEIVDSMMAVSLASGLVSE